MRQIVLDTETTGLSAADGDRIIEIGCVELIQRKLTGNNLHLYVNPERESHEDALKVHGISNEFLQDKPKFAAIAAQLADYLRGAELIIHNAPFDVGFLNKEFERLNMSPIAEIAGNVIDSLALAKDLFPGKRNSLDALCDRLEVDNSGRTLHGALLDAELLADVYINMTRGQDALMMDLGGEAVGDNGTVPGVDLSRFKLTVLTANETETAAHHKVLSEINKACESGSIWERAPT
ncbi:MAG: DNA polymerase III subunit epsilon [Burkholderiaceae bacterium]|jgi:DNA polymerase-3 subunit epsilon